MLLLCVAIALITVGFVVPCILDVARTPRELFDLPAKQTWLVVVIAFWAFGAIAWLAVGRREVHARQYWSDVAIARALRYGGRDEASVLLAPTMGRQPVQASAGRFVAPDDNPDFLLHLERMIRDMRDGV